MLDNLNRRDRLGDLGIDGNIILKKPYKTRIWGCELISTGSG
jgi:hypothetical protein